jgi:hypothetical protein
MKHFLYLLPLLVVSLGFDDAFAAVGTCKAAEDKCIASGRYPEAECHAKLQKALSQGHAQYGYFPGGKNGVFKCTK